MKAGKCTIAVLIIFLLSACASQRLFEETYSTWVGAPIEELEKLWGPPKLIFQENGYKIYQYELWKDCTIYWLCDESGIIRSWRYEGKRTKMAPFS